MAAPSRFLKIGPAFFTEDAQGEAQIVSDPETLKGLKAGQLPFGNIPINEPFKLTGQRGGPAQAPTPQPTQAPQDTGARQKFTNRLAGLLGDLRGVDNLSDLQAKRQAILRQSLLAEPFTAREERVLPIRAKRQLLREAGK